jgi:ABC-type lipoprotein release transport system permease subunit
MRRRRLPFDYAVRNLGRRPLRTILTGASSALVAGLLVATAAFVTSLTTSFSSAGRDDTAIFLSSVAERDIVRSTVPAGVESLISGSVKGILAIDGTPAISPEIHMGTNLRLGAEPPKDGPDTVHQAFIRGVTPRAFLVHDTVTLIRGETPRPGEVIVGRLVSARFGVPEDLLSVGRHIRFEGGSYRIAGTFAAPGTTIESEIWTPLYELRGQTRRDDSSVVFVRVSSPDVFADLNLFAKRRLDLELICIPSSLYYKELAAYFEPIRALTWVLALMIVAAALFGGANTLNAAVQDRVRELATLRAVGYPVTALVLSLLQESVVLAAAGGLVGLGFARFAVTGSAVRIAMSAFALEVDAAAILVGFAGVLLIGAFGTIPAILRVYRLPIASALKES